MALLTNNPNFTELIKFTKNGIEVADYVGIRKALVDRLKEIYGRDIDVATNTADGQKIEMDTLIISNILQTIKALYGNLDVNTAQGKYLEILCALSNVYRKPAQKSTASLNIKLLTTNAVSQITVGPNGADYSSLDFVDVNGVTWRYQPSTVTLIEASDTNFYSIIVTCTQSGQVRAPSGSITQLVESTLLMDIVQPFDAEVGTNEESDADLRARRSGSLSTNASTVLQSLRGKLLDVAAIQDVLIYNNDDENSHTANDTTTIPPHSVYAILRYLDNAKISDALVGTILYEYMTPGIKYVEPDADVETNDNGEKHSYTYASSPIPQIVHWKKAIPMKPSITLTIQKLTHYTESRTYSSLFDVSTLAVITNAVKEYMNNLPLGEIANTEYIKVQAQLSDPMFKNKPTFFISACTITDATNPDTYYNYEGTYTVISETDSTIVIQID